MSATAATRSSVTLVPFERMHFDPLSPRLPEDPRDWSEDQVLGAMRTEWVIDELAASLLEHGDFMQEPMIVVANTSQ